MARKPAHIELAGGKGPRQRVWETIRRQREDFCAHTIVRLADLDKGTVQTYLQALERGGIIEPLGGCKAIGDRKHYRLTRDTGVDAPRLDRAGRPVTQSRGNEHMWKTMRILQEFSPRELALYASTPEIVIAEAAAKAYVKCLAQAGYLKVVDPGHAFIRGKGARQARYQFRTPKSYTGPRPPMIQRKRSVYDPNLNKVVWSEEPNRDG